MHSFIGLDHSVVLTAWAKKEEMAEGLSRVQLEDQVASLCGQVDLLKSETTSSLEEARQCRREVEAHGAKRDNLLARLNQMEKEAKELKNKNADYVAA